MSTLYEEHSSKPWFPKISTYLSSRYSAIESRMVGTFHYVELHQNNRHTFSHEFGSILRDVGSVFGSLVDRLIRLTGSKPTRKKYLDIGDYRTFLVNSVPDIYLLTVEVIGQDARILNPLCELRSPQGTPKWWDAYNNLKHSEILNYQDGNLENTLNSIGALAILGDQLRIFGFLGGLGSSRIFCNIGYLYSEAYGGVPEESLLFKKKE